jgi:hypothetical protein
MIPRHNFVGKKIGRPNRMSLTCRADIVNMSATDTTVCCLGGVAGRHKSRLYQPSLLGVHKRETSNFPPGAAGFTMAIVRQFPPILMNSPMQTMIVIAEL